MTETIAHASPTLPAEASRLMRQATYASISVALVLILAKLIAWGARIGLSTAALVTWQLERRPHPEQGYRACLGLQRLAREYTPARLEAACARALAIRSPTYRSVASILKTGLDRQPSLFPSPTPALPAHENVRGPDYYH